MATRGKNIGLFLMDGDADGRVKGTLSNWIGVLYRVPRNKLSACKDMEQLKRSGVYFLFGKNDQTNKEVIYVGQASIRQNGEGILNRLQEHNRTKDYWSEVVAVTTTNDSLGATEISYLEHRFWELARDAKRYEVKNDVAPPAGKVSEEKESELEDFIDFTKIILGAFGHKFFESLSGDGNGNPTDDSPVFYCQHRGADASAKRTSDGFVLLKGSKLAQTPTASCPDFALRQRELNKNVIDNNYLTTEDILFGTPSGASCFVCAASTNGLVEWKMSDGTTLKAYEASQS